ncbi:transglycosylase [Bordetella ansorpii]|uniref:Transglycosylase n=1 Tax=Bordetella ansorpii TaxID=288768 RepID=A0A157S5J1_9BORD|nr:lytic transglycosylase domain-containing protein [Bordetella ansorpii]SAI65688.1 transglycosylase [Bordetella ansorpii]
MPDASVAAVRRLAQGVHRQLAEWLRICSVYLGIAVIVTVSMGFALPGLRDQALQVHKALLTALAPTSAQIALESDLNPETGLEAATAVAMAVPAAPASNATGLLGPLGSDKTAAGKSAAAKRNAPAGTSGAQVEALRNYISRKYKVAYDATGVLVNTAYRVGREQRIDPLLLLAVIAIESRYNPFAESAVGAQGLMQVMTRVHQDKFDALADAGRKGTALDPVANIHVGTTILRDCIDRRGSVSAGLACYVGASGLDDNGYGAKVQAERRRLALASGIALARD